MKDYLSELNEAQRAAVEYDGGPELVIAGAGSGKTRVLTYKILHLLSTGVNPHNILALTFTNKAAREMRDRVEKLTGQSTGTGLWMGTFHSIFARILRIHAEKLGFKPDFTIYDAADSRSLVKNILKAMGLTSDAYKPSAVAAEISWAKNNLYSPEEYAVQKDIIYANRECGRGEMHEVYRAYRDRCRVAGAMDFDDLLYYTNVLLRDYPQVRDSYRERFRYVLVDEYQDTNFAQHAIVRQLCPPDSHLCAVGDDAQSIYSFRGANISNILDMDKSYPRLRTFKLERNYRSTGNIISAAGSIISCNVHQIPKDVYSMEGEGMPVEVTETGNEYEEAYLVASRASSEHRRGTPYSEIAVLYRTNAQSKALEEALRARNIPYRVYGGLAFYQRKEIKDAISYFRLSVNPDDDEALRRIINEPKRGIGDTTVNKLFASATAGHVSAWRVLLNPAGYGLDVNRGTLAKLNGFTALLAGFIADNNAGMTADALAKEIIERTGLMSQYANLGNAPENVSKRENLYALISGVEKAVADASERGEVLQMSEFLGEVSLMTDADTVADNEAAVTLMTIHSAKGLEFDTVFVVGAEEELLPSAMAMHGKNPAAEVEEERRLMYVAITRAKRLCVVTFARTRTLNGLTRSSLPSRFLREMDRRYIRITGGTKIGVTRSSSMPRATERPVFRPQPTQQPPMLNQATSVPPSAAMKPLSQAGAPQSAAAPVCPEGFRRYNAGEIEAGQRVVHTKFGAGTVTAVDAAGMNEKISVRFDADGVERTLLLKFAMIKLI